MVLLMGPLTEEGLMIGIAIVAILIVIGFLFEHSEKNLFEIKPKSMIVVSRGRVGERHL